MWHLLAIICGINILFSELSTALYLNDTCTVARSNAKGVCRFVEHCPIVVIEIVEQLSFPTLCGFERKKEVICCPNQKPKKSDSKPDKIAIPQNRITPEYPKPTGNRISQQSLCDFLMKI